MKQNKVSTHGEGDGRAATPVQDDDTLLSTAIHYYALLEFASKESLQSIIPPRTYISASRTLSLLIWLYLKPSTMTRATLAISADTRSTHRRISYLKELGYLSEDKYYWTSKAMEGYISAVRYSVNAKGKAALKRFIESLAMPVV